MHRYSAWPQDAKHFALEGADMRHVLEDVGAEHDVEARVGKRDVVAIVLGDLPHAGVSVLAGAHIDGIDRKSVIDEPLRLPAGPRTDFKKPSCWTERRYHAP
jgi:hypothetical protein